MLNKGFEEHRRHGTEDFPLEYYLVDNSHPRYKMSHHWHSETELLYIQKGHFLLSLNGKEYTLGEGDLCYISSGALHGGMPQDCTYECLCFNSDIILRHSDLVRNYLKDVENSNALIQPVFTKVQPGILKCASRMFAAVRSKKPPAGSFWHYPVFVTSTEPLFSRTIEKRPLTLLLTSAYGKSRWRWNLSSRIIRNPSP